MLQEIKQRKVGKKDWSLSIRRKHSGAHSPTQVLKGGKLKTSCSVPALLIHHSISALVFPYLKITWSKNHVFNHLDQTEENVSWGKGKSIELQEIIGLWMKFHDAAIPDYSSEGRLAIATEIINAYFLQYGISISTDILPKGTKWFLYKAVHCNTDYKKW